GAAVQALAQIGLSLNAFAWAGVAARDPASVLQPIVALNAAGRNATAQSTQHAAQAALLGAPINNVAVRLLGQAADQRGDKAAARRLMALSNRLSRRDGVAQSWLINDAVSRGNAPDILRHYDALLRIYPQASGPLMQQLATIIAVPAGRAALRPYMVASNPWRDTLLGTAIGTLPDSGALAQLVLASPQLPDTPGNRDFAAELTRRLAVEGHEGLLRRVYARLPGGDARAATTIDWAVNAAVDGYAPASWGLATDGNFGGALRSIGTPPTTDLEGFAMPGTRGVVANKLVWMAPGRATLRWSVTERDVNREAWANWQLRCGAKADGAVLGESGNMFIPSTANSLSVTVPAHCPAVHAQLVVSGGDGRDPARIVIGMIALSR
ncbi:MAG: hypothetical protein ACKOUM_00955, partial [Sphingopyxis sp.]